MKQMSTSSSSDSAMAPSCLTSPLFSSPTAASVAATTASFPFVPVACREFRLLFRGLFALFPVPRAGSAVAERDWVATSADIFVTRFEVDLWYESGIVHCVRVRVAALSMIIATTGTSSGTGQWRNRKESHDVGSELRLGVVPCGLPWQVSAKQAQSHRHRRLELWNTFGWLDSKIVIWILRKDTLTIDSGNNYALSGCCLVAVRDSWGIRCPKPESGALKSTGLQASRARKSHIRYYQRYFNYLMQEDWNWVFEDATIPLLPVFVKSLSTGLLTSESRRSYLSTAGGTGWASEWPNRSSCVDVWGRPRANLRKPNFGRWSAALILV